MTWEYVKVKRPCAICGGTTLGISQLMPFCVKHETVWWSSPERAEAATARQRFVDRVKAEEKKDG